MARGRQTGTQLKNSSRNHHRYVFLKRQPNDFWCKVKFSFCLTSRHKAIWMENLAIYQKSSGAFFQAPLQLIVGKPIGTIILIHRERYCDKHRLQNYDFQKVVWSKSSARWTIVYMGLFMKMAVTLFEQCPCLTFLRCHEGGHSEWQGWIRQQTAWWQKKIVGGVKGHLAW